MSETKHTHTPGPWTHDGPPDNIIVWSGPETRVCFMTSNGPAEANARLIAASPDLLLNLKNAIDIIEKHVPRDALGVDHMGDFSVPGGVMTWAVLDEHLHYMRKAISKAEGSLT